MRVHGGRWADYLEKHGNMPLDLSSNTSPLGIPQGALAAATAALAQADRYPDPQSRRLRRALAARHGLADDMVLVGNGAGDLIDRLALALHPKRALLTAPTFGEYRAALERVGCAVEEHFLNQRQDFQVDETILPRITSGLDVLILCEPNNPTGRTTDTALLAQVAQHCDECGTLLVVDECFNDFLDDPATHSLLPTTRAHHILVLRAFTKFYGMAGLRLGWCACADRDLLDEMRDAGQPWPVSIVAQEAGIAALADDEYAARVRDTVSHERAKLSHSLCELGCRVVPGEANYLLFFSHIPRLAERLAQRGVLIRDCSDYAGLGPGWYRIAVRGAHERAEFLHAMEEVQR